MRVRRSSWLIVAVVMLGNFVGPLYLSVANVALPNLVAAFGSDVDAMQWVISSRPVVPDALARLGDLLARHGVPPQNATALLAAMATQSAQVQAYGDTFLFATLLLAVGTPLALFLGKRPGRARRA